METAMMGSVGFRASVVSYPVPRLSASEAQLHSKAARDFPPAPILAISVMLTRGLGFREMSGHLTS